MNEEQRKQRDARVAELADEAVAAWDLGHLREAIRERINLALDEQAKEIAAAIRAHHVYGSTTMMSEAADIAAGFGDDR